MADNQDQGTGTDPNVPRGQELRAYLDSVLQKVGTVGESGPVPPARE